MPLDQRERKGANATGGGATGGGFARLGCFLVAVVGQEHADAGGDQLLAEFGVELGAVGGMDQMRAKRERVELVDGYLEISDVEALRVYVPWPLAQVGIGEKEADMSYPEQ